MSPQNGILEQVVFVFFFFLKETGDKLNGGWFCDLHVTGTGAVIRAAEFPSLKLCRKKTTDSGQSTIY